MKCYRIAAFSLLFLLHNLTFGQTADLTEGCATFEVNFTPPAGVNSYFWDFGDMIGSSQEMNPTYNYTTPGQYEVIFRETINGPQVGQSITINVYAVPTITLEADPSGGCAPLATTLTANVDADPAIIFTNYTWDFGDTQSDNGPDLNTVMHTYTNPGAYNVAMQWQTNFASCNDLVIAPALVTPAGPPNINFGTFPANPFSCTAPFEVNFINGNPDPTLTWNWDFGDGQMSDEVSPTHTFNGTGDFTVTLTGTDGVGCAGTFSQVVSVGAPTASFDVPNDSVCGGQNVFALINTSTMGAGVSYNWTFDNGAFPATSTQLNPTVNFADGVTNISLEVTATDGNGMMCSSTATGTVFVDNPDATFTSIPTYSCTDKLEAQFVPNNTDAAQYIWTFSDFQGNGGTSDEMSPFYTYSNNDTTTHGINGLLEFVTTLTVISEAGCMSTFTQVDTIWEPNALFLPDVVEGCAPLTVNFENLSTNDVDFVAFNWDWGDGSNDLVNTDDDQTHTFTTPGEYEVVLSLTDVLGCQDTSFVQIIEVGEPIVPDFTLSQTQICPGDSITLTDITNSDLIDGWHFFTDDNRSFHCYQEDVLTHTFESGTGFFDVTLEVEYNGCYSQVTQTDAIEVQGPIAHIDYLVDCDDPFNISFRDSSDDATSVLWEFGDMTDTTVNDPFHTYADIGAYTVYLTASNNLTGCPDSRDSVVVNVADIEAVFDLDSFLCLGLEYDLDATLSPSVNAECHRGYTWYFSDPNDRPITTQNPSVTHIFEMRDTNFVTLITTDINGCTDTLIDTVRVFGVYPELAATPLPICIPSTVQFTSTGTTADTTINNYEWDFGDGVGMSNDPNPTYTYTTQPAGGAFQVTLTVEDVIPCSSIGIVEVPVYIPVSTISASPSLDICVGDTITFSATDFTAQGSNLDFMWDFGIFGTGNNQMESVVFTTAGSFNVTLNYSEQSTGCEGMPDMVTVNVQEFPVADFTTSVDGQPFVCAGQIITFTDASTTSSPLTIGWDFGDGFTATGSPVTHTFTASGIVPITEFVSTTNGCADTLVRELNFLDPIGDLDFTTDNICYGDEITFTLVDTMDVEEWTIDFGDGTTVDNQGVVTHAYTVPLLNDMTIVRLILSTQNGECEKVIEIPLSLDAIDLNFEGFINQACVGDEILFNANSPEATTYAWDLGDGTMSSDQSLTHAYTEPGIFYVTLEAQNALGCTALLLDSVSVGETPTLTGAEDQVVCFDQPATLSVESDISGTIFQWTPAGLVADPNAATTTTDTVGTITPPIVFTITASSPTNQECFDEEMVTITPIPPISIDTSFGPSVCPGQELVVPIVNQDGLYTYSWSSNPEGVVDFSGTCTNCSNPVIKINEDAMVEDSIITITASLSITGEPDLLSCSPDIQFEVSVLSNNIPNAFTPDGDGRNDFFNIPVREFYDIEYFQIFNRWGNKVYDDETPATGWDGNFNGSQSPSDVYIFLFKTTNSECVFRGNVTLIR